MNFLDILILIPVAWFGFKGFKNGLIKELFLLLALILGIYITYKFSGFVASKLPPSSSAPIIAFLITFIAVLVGVHIVGRFTEKIIKLVIPELINKILGICFGVIKVIFICSILLHFIKTIDKKEIILKTTVVEESVLYKYVDQSTNFIVDWSKIEPSEETETK